MLKFGAILRLLTLAVCLVPFTSDQQAAGALAPILPVAPVPTSDLPAAPTNEEEEDEREEEPSGKERHATYSRHRTLTREQVGTLPPISHTPRTHFTGPRTTPPCAADPFRNGLGTPYRC